LCSQQCRPQGAIPLPMSQCQSTHLCFVVPMYVTRHPQRSSTHTCRWQQARQQQQPGHHNQNTCHHTQVLITSTGFVAIRRHHAQQSPNRDPCFWCSAQTPGNKCKSVYRGNHSAHSAGCLRPQPPQRRCPIPLSRHLPADHRLFVITTLVVWISTIAHRAWHVLVTAVIMRQIMLANQPQAPQMRTHLLASVPSASSPSSSDQSVAWLCQSPQSPAGTAAAAAAHESSSRAAA
jgi:hypothetical protein